jgi:hypothetical protein
MTYTAYTKDTETLCVVAVKLNQTNVHANSHTTWGVVTCDICGEQFAIGPSRMQGPRIGAEECAKRLQALLNEDHKKTAHTPTGMRFPIEPNRTDEPESVQLPKWG